MIKFFSLLFSLKFCANFSRFCYAWFDYDVWSLFIFAQITERYSKYMFCICVMYQYFACIMRTFCAFFCAIFCFICVERFYGVIGAMFCLLLRFQGFVDLYTLQPLQYNQYDYTVWGLGFIILCGVDKMVCRYIYM